MNDTIIEIKDLKINIKIDEGTLTAVRGVDFEIKSWARKKVGMHEEWQQ